MAGQLDARAAGPIGRLRPGLGAALRAAWRAAAEAGRPSLSGFGAGGKGLPARLSQGRPPGPVVLIRVTPSPSGRGLLPFLHAALLILPRQRGPRQGSPDRNCTGAKDLAAADHHATVGTPRGTQFADHPAMLVA